MTRRSLRLIARGYYNCDEDSDSRNTTSVSAVEPSVRVFSQKRDTRKARLPVTDNSRSADTEPPVTASQTDSQHEIVSGHYRAVAKKAACLLLLILILLSGWCFFPFLSGRMTLLQIEYQSDAISPASLQTSPTKATSAVDSAILPVVVQEVVTRLLELLPIRRRHPVERRLVLDAGTLTPELKQALEMWLADHIKEHDEISLRDQRCSTGCGRPVADKMADFALESLGSSVVRSRSSQTYRGGSACERLFGLFPRCRSEGPHVVIQGHSVLLPGRCWPFQGAKGTLFISLSHPVTISHVTLGHVPHGISPSGRIDSAPKDFEIYGTVSDEEEGTLLGKFTYDEDGDSTQTFELPKHGEVHRFVELRVLSNWGHAEYTCLYRFRVHGTMASTR